MKSFNVATYEQLRDAIFEMSNDHVFGRDAANGPYTVTLRADITLDDSLPIIRAASEGPAIFFEGGDHTINGQDSHRAFFVESGNIEIRNLTIDDVAAIGGDGGSGGLYNGGGGGGGLGAGAAIFVNTGAEVSVTDVEFADARAQGGRGGADIGDNAGDSGGGGGGIGGDGGDGGFGGGGGGGYQGAGGDGGDLEFNQNAVGAGAGGGGGEFGDGGASAFKRDGGAGGGGQQGDGGDAIQRGSAAGAGGGGATADGGDVDDHTAGAGGADEGGDGGAEVANDTNGIDGQDGSALGGGGGGSAPGSDTNSSDTIEYVAGAGGDGGISGGGGGAGYSDNVGGNGGSGGGGGGSTGPASPGGQGGDFAGGGGAYSEGGQGGFGGGGGGASIEGDHEGGAGGFGAGGGGGAVRGSGGTHAGSDDSNYGYGGGGAALGGAIFVRDGGRLLFNDETAFTGSKILEAGLGGNGSPDLKGSKLGESGFLHGSGTLALNAEAGTTWQLTVKGVAGDGTIEKVGAGTVILASNTVYRTETLVTAGTMELADANLGSSATVIKSGATLQGTGSVGELSVESGATLAPGAESGTIEAKDTVLSAGSTYLTDIGSFTDEPGNGTFDYDLLRVNGTLDLGNATLDASLVDEFIPELGKEIVLIDNDGSEDLVSGTFAGLKQDATVSLDAAVFSISYKGGDDNDVSLTAVGLAPSALALDSETVAHSEGADATVGIFTTTDPDTDDTHVYSLVDGGADNALFEIRDDALTIKDPTSVAEGAYTVRVATTDEDNLTFEKDFTISVEDDVQPTITSVKGPAAGNYETGDTLSFTVSFSEPVQRTETPTNFLLAFDNGAVSAELASKAATAVTEATFEYVIQAGDRDLDGIMLVLEPFYGAYEDVAGNELLYEITDPPQIDFDPTGVTVNAEIDGNPEPNPNPNPDPDPQPPVDNTIIPGSAVAIDATPNAGGSPVTVAGSPDEIDEVQIAGSVTLGEDLENAYLLGTGDYTVEGNSADNVIYGNAGDTTIIASAGNDTIDGGYGDNIVAFEGESSGYAIRVVDGIAEVENLETGDVTGVANVAQLTFADGIQPLFATGQGMVAGFYEAFLGRELDQNGFEYWMDQSAGGMDPFEMVQHFIAPPEFGERTESLTTSQFVEWLYVGFLDREPDATGLAYWIDAIEGGTSYADAAANFVFAEEVGIRMDELLDRNDWLHIV